MLDIHYIRENAAAVKKAAQQKGLAVDVDALLKIDEERRSLMQKIEVLQTEKNALNGKICLAKTDTERKEIIAEGTKIKKQIDEAEPRLKEIRAAFDALMVQMPTVPASDTPEGKSDEENVEIARWGTIPEFSFKPKTHIELGTALDLIDFEKGAKTAGYRGYYLKNEGASLVMALMLYGMNKMISKGFAPFIPPTLVKEFALFGSGYFKGKEYDGDIDEIYQVTTSEKEADGSASRDRKFLVGTSEPSLLAYYADEMLDETQLPLRVCGFSQCYRSEIGSYGKDTKGMYRVHEFMKIEQVVVAPADVAIADKLHEEMVDISHEIHDELGLPHRRLRICTGDMGVGKYKAYDHEAWMPGMNRWGETGSGSNFLDWQARRLNIRYTDKNGKKQFAYLLNNTALPSPRVFIAILENYQQADGSVIIPEVLRKYMPNNLAAITPKKK